MGARIPPNERPRRGGISCEFCGRAVPSASALHSHQAALHSQALKEKAKIKPIATKATKVQKPEPRKVNLRNVKPKTEVDSKTPQKKLSSDLIISKTPAANPKTDAAKTKADNSKPKIDNTTHKLAKSVSKEEESTQSPAMEGKKKTANSTSGQRRKVEYQCPKCEKLFPVLFVAQKHIQKHHCVNSKDKKVAVTSPDIIQPLLLELCMHCDKKFSKPHDCPNRPEIHVISYHCLGCQQQYNNNKLFDLHVANVHGDQLESLFFPSEEEFVRWKEDMESQTGCNYVIMGKYDSKQIYQCSEFTENDTENTLLLCPSSFIVKKFPKGLQIHFYPSHYQHECNKYKLKDQYKTYTITDLLIQAGFANGNSDDDLYLKFKSLMESIVLDAAKINVDMLKTLMSRAKDMMSILKTYKEDNEVETVKDRSTISLSTSNTSVRENDDSQTSDSLQTRSRKRGLEENSTAAKKLRKGTSDAKILVKTIGKKKFSLADDKDSDKILDELDTKANKDGKSTQSPSFNDTYKDFIMNASKTVTTGKKKNVVKTKMGQFKGPSPKKVVKRDSIGSTKDIKYEVRERDEDCNILVLKI